VDSRAWHEWAGADHLELPQPVTQPFLDLAQLGPLLAQVVFSGSLGGEQIEIA
jgi:hypothetical protein